DGEEHRLVARAEGATVEALALEVPGEGFAAPLHDPRARAGALDEVERVEARLTGVGDPAPVEVVGAGQDAAHDPPQSMSLCGGRTSGSWRWGAPRGAPVAPPAAGAPAGPGHVLPNPPGARPGDAAVGHAWDPRQLVEQELRPAVDVVLADLPPHMAQPVAALLERELDRAVDGRGHVLHVVGVDQQRVGQLVRGAGEPAQDEDAVVVVAGGH